MHFSIFFHETKALGTERYTLRQTARDLLNKRDWFIVVAAVRVIIEKKTMS